MVLRVCKANAPFANVEERLVDVVIVPGDIRNLPVVVVGAAMADLKKNPDALAGINSDTRVSAAVGLRNVSLFFNTAN